MATPAEIRANYYRGKQRSPEAQAIAKRLEEAPRKSIQESSRISRFNQGRDPFLNTLSDASVALAPGGFSSVDTNPGARRETVRAGVEAEIPDWLPTEVENRLRERQDAMGRKLTEREKEQAEYERMAGVPTRTLLPGEDTGTLVSSATKREQAAKPETEAERLLNEDPVQRALLAPIRKQLAEQKAKEQDVAIKLDQFRASAGKDVQKKREDREKRDGAKAQDLFASWDADKAARVEGELYQKDARRRLSQVRRALLRGENLTAEQFNELIDEEAGLSVDLEQRDQGFSKGVTGLGRSREATRAARKAAADRIRASELARAAAAETEAGGVGQARATANEYTLPLTNTTRSFSDLFGISSSFSGNK
jgi:hypothetical protein